MECLKDGCGDGPSEGLSFRTIVGECDDVTEGQTLGPTEGEP